MPRFTTKRHEQILTSMIAKVVSRTRMSDVSNTSGWKHVLAAAARQDDEQYYQMSLLRLLFDITKASGDDLDERAKEIQPAVITRELLRKSSGNVVMSRSGTAGTTAIAIGEIGATAGGKQFKTTGAGLITSTSPIQIAGHSIGQDSGLIPATAVEGGADGNVEDGTIIKFITQPIGITEITNPSRFAYGLDEEDDDSFRNKRIQYIATLARSTVGAIEAAVLGAEDSDTGAKILFVKVVEDIVNRGYSTCYIDDGTGSAMTTELVTGENVCEGLAGPPVNTAVGGETYLWLDHKPIDETTLNLITNKPIPATPMIRGVDYYVDPASGQLYFTTALVQSEIISADYTRYTGLIESAQKIIDGDSADRVNWPGYRAAGTWVLASTPQVLIQTVQLSIVVAEGYDETEIEDSVRDAIRNYINTLGISGDVIASEIIHKIKAVNGVYDLTLILPASNVILLDDQMARTTDTNITIN